MGMNWWIYTYDTYSGEWETNIDERCFEGKRAYHVLKNALAQTELLDACWGDIDKQKRTIITTDDEEADYIVMSDREVNLLLDHFDTIDYTYEEDKDNVARDAYQFLSYYTELQRTLGKDNILLMITY